MPARLHELLRQRRLRSRDNACGKRKNYPARGERRSGRIERRQSSASSVCINATRATISRISRSISAGPLRRGHWRERLRQKHADSRMSVAGACKLPSQNRKTQLDANLQTSPVLNRSKRLRSGPIADRPHAAFDSRDLRRILRRDPPALRPNARSASARIFAQPVFFQQRARTLPGMRRRRADQIGNEFSAAGLSSLAKPARAPGSIAKLSILNITAKTSRRCWS